ncbi:MAG: FecR family protein [Proteiniphilum sp.]|jgi:ferric-dicitrate binding protein FerR (iron transport regulator)|nr:FecR family protein [Proteiniphilum sp.]
MNREDDNHKSAEQAIRQMDHLTEITAGELRATLSDPERFRACCDLMEISRIMQEDAAGNPLPEVEKAWDDFRTRNNLSRKRRHTLPRKILGRIAVVAAVVAALIALTLRRFDRPGTSDPVTVFLADDKAQQIILQTSSGHQVAIEEAGDTTLTRIGVIRQKGDDREGAPDYRALAAHPAAEATEMYTLSTPRGKDFKMLLSDGTEVWLNAESRLEYPATFSGKQREVRLTGEACFTVAPDAGRPFLIRTDHLQTRVLGTEFNVCSYTATNSHVTLIDGSVEVASGQGTDFIRIAPGEDAALCDDGSFLVREVDLSSYIYRKEGYFYYDNVTLEEIMQHLGRWYNVTVKFQHRDAMKYRMHFLSNREAGLDFAILLLNRMEKVSILRQGDTLTVR